MQGSDGKLPRAAFEGNRSLIEPLAPQAAWVAPDADTQASCNARGYGAAHCAHVAFMTDHDSVRHWIGTAIEFMSRHGAR